MDPTRRRSGGALLGDRIRMNSLAAENVFMRSLATRRQNLATSAVLKDAIGLLQLANFDLIVVETAGIGQSDSEIADLVDHSLYVMTSEYGAASQLEKIDMLDFADMIVLNKFEKRGAEDALRDVRKQWRRNHPERAQLPDAQMPVFPTIASRFNDPGVNRLFAELCKALDAKAKAAGRQTSLDSRRRRADRVRFARSADSRLAHSLPGGDRGERPPRAAGCAARGGGGTHARTACMSRCARCTMRRCRRRSSAIRTRRSNDPQADATRRELRAAYNRALDEIGRRGRRRAEALAAARARRSRRRSTRTRFATATSPARTTRRR